MKRGRPKRRPAELQFRFLVACAVRHLMHQDGLTLEQAAERAHEIAAHVAGELQREWRDDRGLLTAPELPPLTTEDKRVVTKALPGGPPWLWKVSPSAAKKAYCHYFGDGSRSRPRRSNNKVT